MKDAGEYSSFEALFNAVALDEGLGNGCIKDVQPRHQWSTMQSPPELPDGRTGRKLFTFGAPNDGISLRNYGVLPADVAGTLFLTVFAKRTLTWDAAKVNGWGNKVHVDGCITTPGMDSNIERCCPENITEKYTSDTRDSFCPGGSLEECMLLGESICKKYYENWADNGQNFRTKAVVQVTMCSNGDVKAKSIGLDNGVFHRICGGTTYAQFDNAFRRTISYVRSKLFLKIQGMTFAHGSPCNATTWNGFECLNSEVFLNAPSAQCHLVDLSSFETEEACDLGNQCSNTQGSALTGFEERSLNLFQCDPLTASCVNCIMKWGKGGGAASIWLSSDSQPPSPAYPGGGSLAYNIPCSICDPDQIAANHFPQTPSGTFCKGGCQTYDAGISSCSSGKANEGKCTFKVCGNMLQLKILPSMKARLSWKSEDASMITKDITGACELSTNVRVSWPEILNREGWDDTSKVYLNGSMKAFRAIKWDGTDCDKATCGVDTLSAGCTLQYAIANPDHDPPIIQHRPGC